MTRLTTAVLALLCLAPAVSASLTPDKIGFERRPADLRVTLTKTPFFETTEIPPPPEAQITNETEVYLDGRQCRYKDIPTGATITRMVLAPDQRTILRIEFRSSK